MLHATQPVPPVPMPYDPAAQGLHEDVPGPVAYEPAMHLVQTETPCTSLKLPAAHLTHAAESESPTPVA